MATSTTSISNILSDFITREVLDGQAITNDEELLLSGMINSIGVMRLVTFMQDTFDIEIPAQDVTVDNMATVNSIAQYLEPRLKS